MTIFKRIQLIVDNDKEAIQCLRRLKRKSLFKRVIKARRLHGMQGIPLKELKEKIQKHVEEDHCHQ